MNVTFFSTPDAFRKWLKKFHKKEKELLVGYYKVGSGKPSMTWSESVDQALCYGWIDGVRKSIEGESYCIRFTPRKRASIWSEVNIKKVAELSKKGLMKPEGLEAFQFRSEKKSGIYSHENEPSQLNPEYEKQFKQNKIGWGFFNLQAPSYKKIMIHWIMSAKQEKTRLSRLTRTIEISAEQKRMQ